MKYCSKAGQITDNHIINNKKKKPVLPWDKGCRFLTMATVAMVPVTVILNARKVQC